MSLLSGLDKLTSKTPELAAIRKRAGGFFREHGLPTRKDPEWRYTSLKSLNDQGFVSSLIQETFPGRTTLHSVAGDLNPAFLHFVFINGRLDRTLTDIDDLPNGVSWSAEVHGEDYIDAMGALNVAVQGQGLTLTIGDGVVLERPLQIHFHTATEGGPALMINPRFVVRFGARSQGTLIESYSSLNGEKSLQNSHTEIFVGEGAKLNHVRLQEEGDSTIHVGRTHIRASANAQLNQLVLSSGATLSRHNLDVIVEGSGLQAQVLGAVIGSGTQHFDQSTMIDHQVGESNTTQDYKGLLDGECRSIFTGKIRIRKYAQKANSEQLVKNLLLSDKAEADALPQMMIEADDVKAAHGATVGQLNAEELFYLRSRGLPEAVAIPLLAGGFIMSVTDKVDDELVRPWLRRRVQNALDQAKVGLK